MPVVLSIGAVVFTKIYLSKTESGFIKVGAVLGSIWFLMSVGFDLLLFMGGLMQMSFSEYLMDIGVTYLIYPVVTVGMGWLLEAK